LGDATVTIDGEATISSSAGTNYGTIHLQNTSAKLIINHTKAQVINAGVGAAVYNAASTAAGAITLSNGTIKNDGAGAAIYADAAGSILLNGGAVISGSGTAIYINQAAAVTVGGASVTSGTGAAIYVAADSTVTVNNGSQVKSATASGVGVEGMIILGAAGAKLDVSDAGTLIENSGSASTVYNKASTQSDAVNLAAGTISNTGGAVAIYLAANTGKATVTGGKVTATDNHAIYIYGTGKAEISNGTIENNSTVATILNTSGALTVNGNAAIDNKGTGAAISLSKTSQMFELGGSPVISDRITMEQSFVAYGRLATSGFNGTGYIIEIPDIETNTTHQHIIFQDTGAIAGLTSRFSLYGNPEDSSYDIVPGVFRLWDSKKPLQN
jgi:hypothetical protein